MGVPILRLFVVLYRLRSEELVRLVLAFAIALVLAACTRGGTSTRNTRAAQEQAPTYVRVENRAFNDMTIYVVRSAGERIRLGLVNGASTATFTIPNHLMFGTTSLRFMADPIGASRTPVSEEIGVRPGDTVVLRIPAY